MAKTRFVWDPVSDSVLQEKDGAGVTQVTYTNEPSPYGPLRSERRGPQTRQFHFDALGSTRALTGDAQTVTDSFVYDACGNEVSHTGTHGTRFTWLGRLGYLSATGGVVDVRMRRYSPESIRWLAPDLAFPESGWNTYLYSTNSPFANVDPSGMFCEPASPCAGLSREQICSPDFLKKFKDENGKSIDTGRGGGVICCDGKAYPCLWPFKDFPDPKKCEEYDKCVMDHEEKHAETAKCDPSRKEPYRDPFNPDQKGDKMECRFRATHIGCLCGKLRRRETNTADCAAFMGKAVKTLLNYVLGRVDILFANLGMAGKPRVLILPQGGGSHAAV